MRSIIVFRRRLAIVEAESTPPKVEQAIPVADAAPVAPELVPVPRSVFDDDFFRVTGGRAPAAAEEWLGAGQANGRGFEGSNAGRPMRVQYVEPEIVEAGEPETVVRVPSFVGAVSPEPVESDELDIPAFLRRGN